MNTMFRSFIFLTCIVLFFSSNLIAETTMLTPSDDMYTDPDHPVGHATEELWTADWSPLSNYQRINMQFDLSVLQDASIESATLHLYRFFGCPSGDPTTTQIYHITTAWSEDTWSENVHSPHGDAVWANHVFSSNGWHDIDITSLVQAWVDGDMENHGLVFVAVSSKFTKCYSKEAVNPDHRPYLEVTTQQASVEDKGAVAVGSDFALDAYPNPFNPSTNVRLSLATHENVRVAVYNVYGEIVDEIHSGPLAAGFHHFSYHPSGLASGVYFIHMNAGSQRLVRRIIIVQ